MQVETARSGTEVAAFAGVGLTVLGGVLPWVSESRILAVAAAVAVLLGAGAGGALLYGRWEPRDRVAVLGAGVTVAALALGAHGRVSGSGPRSSDPGIGLFVAAFGGLVLAAAGAYGCWTCDAITGAGSASSGDGERGNDRGPSASGGDPDASG